MRRIVQNGYALHLVVEDATSEAVALAEAILNVDAAVSKPDVTAADIDAAFDAIADAEASWCRAHKFRHDRVVQMALVRLSEKLRIVEARHATA